MKFPTLRKMTLRPEEKKELLTYCHAMGYALVEDEVPYIKHLNKKMFLQRSHGDLFAVANIQIGNHTEQTTENLSSLIRFYQMTVKYQELPNFKKMAGKLFNMFAKKLHANKNESMRMVFSIIYMEDVT